MVKDVNKDNFEKEVLENKGLVVCDFNADWCGPCRMLRPIIDEVSDTRSDAKFVSINIDDEDEIDFVQLLKNLNIKDCKIDERRKEKTHYIKNR
mgnify:CR=1 FL=1